VDDGSYNGLNPGRKLPDLNLIRVGELVPSWEVGEEPRYYSVICVFNHGFLTFISE